MLKLLLCIFLSLSLVSCGFVSRFVGGVLGTSRICVNGVSYLQFTSGASVEYTMDGKIKTCNEKGLF